MTPIPGSVVRTLSIRRAASALRETPKVGMRWRPEFIHCIGKRGDDFMVVLDIGQVFSAGAHDRADSSLSEQEQHVA